MLNRRKPVQLILFAAVAGVLSLYIVKCSIAGGNMPTCQEKVEDMQKAAKLELSHDSNDEAIKLFLTKHQFIFTFDRFANRYQGIIRDVKNPPGIDCAVVAYIYVGKDGKFLRSEFVDSYTGI